MKNLVRVTKGAAFDCAHMLSDHDGLCKNLHGHTYKVQVTVEGERILGGPSCDMVIDFKHLKEAMQQVIMKDFDHALIVSDDSFRGFAEEELLNWAVTHQERYFIMPARTTAENMAQYFCISIRDYLTTQLGLTNLHSVSVRVYETPTSCAEVSVPCV